jgi:hypothetical protein
MKSDIGTCNRNTQSVPALAVADIIDPENDLVYGSVFQLCPNEHLLYAGIVYEASVDHMDF